MRDMGCESNAHESNPIRTLARSTKCRYCTDPIYLAMCRDGKWRTFDTQTVPPAPFGVWAWRRTWGMEEQERVSGKRLHYCAEYNGLPFRFDGNYAKEMDR